MQTGGVDGEDTSCASQDMHVLLFYSMHVTLTLVY